MEHLHIRLILRLQSDVTDIRNRRGIGQGRLCIYQTDRNIFQKQRHSPGKEVLLVRHIIGKQFLQMLLIDLSAQARFHPLQYIHEG